MTDAAETDTETHDVVIPYAPRRAFEPFHNSTSRWGIIVAHRRAGKTVAAINKLIRAACECKLPDGRFGYVGPYLAQAKETAWTYLKRFSEPAWRVPPNEAELRVELVGGATIRLHGADNPDRLRGPYFDGVVLDEYASQRSGVWSEVVRPMLADRKGWAAFIGTPKGRNAFYDLWKAARNNPDWFKLMVRADTSGIIPNDELDDMQADMSPEEFSQEMMCAWETAIQGAYYSEAMRRMDAEGRITDLPIDRGVRVHTAWDIGRSDNTAIWFIQCVGRERRLVDYYENHGFGFEHYVQVLHDKRMARGWTYGEHYFPHDIQAHMMDSPLSRIATLQSLGIDPTYPLKTHEVMDGINAVRRMLDRSWIDPIYCERGLDCLRNYRAEWDDKMHTFRNIPLHDQFSDGADALRTFAIQYDDPRAVTDDGRYRRRFRSGQQTSAWSA